jgi:hypothetical protein
MLRLWRAPLDNDRAEWRGRLNYVNTGETRYFHAWPALLAQLQALLGSEADRGTGGDDRDAPRGIGETPG